VTDTTWQILAEHVLVERPPWLRLCEQDVRLPDGRVIEGYLVAQAPDYAIIFAVDGEGRVVTTEEYKHGPGRVVVHLPAGYLEPGEDPLLAAQRELREETGYEADKWQLLGVFCEDGNRGLGWGHHYLAQGAHLVTTADPGDLSEIRTVLLTPAEVRQAVYEGRVAVADIVACIMLGLDAITHNDR
jgi:ADP-ribose pyrophosphatase